ncbi:low affinity vacuolar monovalent cation/H(+) antiporter-like isoform X1 [Sinocyclocheilus grahami]|uniref:Low affinity vacuolar monovalent cation/H(+) antiporter-like n=1 Tax=Sinocyclocheilus grahami TaxID=75366 RepID=A0A672LCG4_SINGR|nr:PREDICTED: low affinity vacuolar monovalent cation/H(+) antiporter-like isoform X1 [Sinocyclocheilus grahami]
MAEARGCSRMALTKHTMSTDVESRRRRSTESSEPLWDHDPKGRRCSSQCDRLCVAGAYLEIPDTPSTCTSQYCGHYTPKCLSAHRHSLHSRCTDDVWQEASIRTTVRAENEFEAHKLANNYKFGFRKWKSHVTERPIEDRSDVVKELYSELNYIKHHSGSLITAGNVIYVLLFGWWISIFYFLVSLLMFCTIAGIPYGKLCLQLSGYFLWPFGKALQKSSSLLRKCCVKFPHCEAIPEEVDEVKESSEVKESKPLLRCAPTEISVTTPPPKPARYWCRMSTYVWLVLGYPLLAVVHFLAIFLSWMMVFTIPVSKMNFRTLRIILLMPPEEVKVWTVKKPQGCETRVLLCCYRAFNWYYYKYTVDGINVFAVNLLPLVIFTLVIGYVDRDNYYVSSEAKFAMALSSIIPLSYYIGMGIASISAQSNFAVGAVVNATFGSITEMAFYITALLQGHRAGNKCYAEIVKSALTGTLLGCILFIPGICMIIGGCKHSEQRFNSRSAGVSSALLFISVGGVFAPTLFSKAYGNFICEGCNNSLSNTTKPFICNNCHYDLSENNRPLFLSHIEPLVYTISVLLPAAYLIGLIFTLKTHSHIYDLHISDAHCHVISDHGAVVHWSRARALLVLILATVLMAACADLSTEHIKPIISNSSVSQYFIGVTILAMVPELPEIVNGIQFALQNNISLSLEVGSCIAVQVCMLQIPLLIFFNAFYDVGFVLIFSDLHLWASIFSVILVNYIFMDGKSDYFQGTALVVVYLILLALYFFAPAPLGC